MKNRNSAIGDIDNYVSLQILDYSNYQLYHFTNIVDFLSSGIKRAKEMIEEWEIHHPGKSIDDSLIRDIAKLTAWYNPSNPGGSLSDLPIALLDFKKDNIVLDLTGNPLYWSNLRLVAQSGAFLFYGDHNKPLEKYLLEINAPYLRCININKNLNEHISKKINIDRTSIYPSEIEIAADANARAISELKLK